MKKRNTKKQERIKENEKQRKHLLEWCNRRKEKRLEDRKKEKTENEERRREISAEKKERENSQKGKEKKVERYRITTKVIVSPENKGGEPVKLKN